MYTQKTYNTLVKITNIAWFLGLTHFHFIKTDPNALAKTRSHWKKFQIQQSHFLQIGLNPARLNFVKFTLLISFFYVIYLCARVFHQQISSDPIYGPEVDFLVKMGYLLTCYSLPVVLQYTVILKLQELPRWITEYLDFFKSMRGNYLQLKFSIFFKMV